MKTLFGMTAFVAGCGLALAQGSFTGQLTPEEYARAGLGKLSSAEMRALDAAFQKYGTTGGQSQAAATPSEPSSPGQVAPEEPRAAPSRISVQDAATGAESLKEEKPETRQGFIRKTRRTAPTASTPSKPEVKPIETHVAGSFAGWADTTVLMMQDGSIWRVDPGQRPYVARRVEDPAVRIYPALFNGHWVEFVDLKTRVRVQRAN